MKRVIYFVSVVCLLLHSCSKDEEKIFSLLLSANSAEFTSIGGKQEIAVTANTKWEVRSGASWLNTETSENMGNGTLVITVQPNSSTTERSAKIFVTLLSGDISEEIIISQQGHVDTPLQVYDWDGTPFKESINLVGIPAVSYGSFDYPGGFPSSTMVLPNTWEIKGEIKDGIMSIDFPDEKFELTSDYKSSTEGLTMGQVFIEYNRNLKVALHKKGIEFDDQVYILYVSDDFSNDLVTFKSGWNFVEIYYNPNWFFGSSEPYRLIGNITQNINVFIENGYHWQIELWT